MSLDAETLRSSLDLVVSRRPQLTERFYELLFERYPQTQSMFTRNSREHQAVLLQQAIAAVVENVEDPEWLTSNLKELGAPSSFKFDVSHSGSSTFSTTAAMACWSSTA